MKIENLKLFLAVAESGSINKTAEQHFLTHQSLGVILKGLEKELNCSLFIRTNKGVALSTEGEVFLPYAKQAVSAIDDYISLRPATINEILHLYTTPVMSKYIQVVQKEPIADQYYLSIHEHSMEELYAFMNNDEKDPQRIYFFPLLEYEQSKIANIGLSKRVIIKDETVTEICHEKNPLLYAVDDFKKLMDDTVMIVGSSYSINEYATKGFVFQKRKRINISDIEICKKMMLEQKYIYSGPKSLCKLQFAENEWKVLREYKCPAIEFCLFYQTQFVAKNDGAMKELIKKLKIIFGA